MLHLQRVLFICVCSAHVHIAYGGSSSLPTREEQANLLDNVQEVFEAIKKLVKDEGLSTDLSVSEDVNKIVSRAIDKLDLVEQVSLMQISCQTNKVCALDAKSEIRNLIEEGKAMLRKCASKAEKDIVVSSEKLNEDTVVATNSGQGFLDSLRNCSKKPGLGVITCYKGIIATDVIPVKNVILKAVENHREAHGRTVSIRKDANQCVEETIKSQEDKVADILANAIACK